MRNADRAILFATMLLLAVSGCDQLSGRNQNRQGGRWYRDGKFPDALALYEQALKKVEDPIVHFNTGLAYRGVFKAGYDKPVLLAFQSEDVCKNIPNTKPVEASICVKEGDRHYNGNECDDKIACPALSTCTKTTFCSMMSTDIANVAATHLQTWLKVQPSDDVLHAEIAKVEAQIADLNEKLEADAGKPDKKPEGAALEDQIKDLGKRIDDLKAKFHVRDMMTQMWLDSDQYTKAVDYWTALLNEKPNDPSLMAVLAGINLKANDWRKSIEWYLKVAAATKDVSAKATAYQFIGNVAWSKLNSHTLDTLDSVELADRGIGALQKAIELQPESTKPVGLQASLFNFRGTANGASWATAIDRASAQDLQRTLHVLNDKAKQKAAPQPPPTPAPHGG
jgi:tetratricopeptide (TPR) repeat protein